MEKRTLKGDNMKIYDLDLKDSDKKLLSFCAKPRTIAEIAAKLDKAYSTINQKLMVFKAKGFIKKIESPSGKVLYILNPKKVTL